jgi:hypothetical protein
VHRLADASLRNARALWALRSKIIIDFYTESDRF